MSNKYSKCINCGKRIEKQKKNCDSCSKNFEKIAKKKEK